jgi:hypothetical protein
MSNYTTVDPQRPPHITRMLAGGYPLAFGMSLLFVRLRQHLT